MVIRLVLLVATLVAALGAGPARAPSRFIPTLEAGDAIPPIPLFAQDGRSFSLAGLRGNAVLVSFIYTRCADARMCPLVSAKFSRMARSIGRTPIRLVLITLDPRFDTPAVLRRYGRAFGQDPRVWTIATGSQTTIDELAARLGIATSASIAGTIVHTEAATVVGPDGRIARTIYGNAWTPADLVDFARATLPGGSTPLIGLRSWWSAALERCGAGGAIGTSAMLGVFGLVGAAVGVAFWLAFRTEPQHR